MCGWARRAFRRLPSRPPGSPWGVCTPPRATPGVASPEDAGGGPDASRGLPKLCVCRRPRKGENNLVLIDLACALIVAVAACVEAVGVLVALSRRHGRAQQERQNRCHFHRYRRHLRLLPCCCRERAGLGVAKSEHDSLSRGYPAY